MHGQVGLKYYDDLQERIPREEVRHPTFAVKPSLLSCIIWMLQPASSMTVQMLIIGPLMRCRQQSLSASCGRRRQRRSSCTTPTRSAFSPTFWAPSAEAKPRLVRSSFLVHRRHSVQVDV